MSELNISMFLAGDNNKGEYISIKKVDRDEVESCINDNSLSDLKNMVGTAHVCN